MLKLFTTPWQAADMFSADKVMPREPSRKDQLGGGGETTTQQDGRQLGS